MAALRLELTVALFPLVPEVVDFGWIYECIKQSKLLGPPDWGGHLLPPAQKCVITRGEADAAAFAIFGLCKHGPEHEEAMRESEAMQVDPVPVAGQSGSNPQNDTSEEMSRGASSSSARDVLAPSLWWYYSRTSHT